MDFGKFFFAAFIVCMALHAQAMRLNRNKLHTLKNNIKEKRDGTDPAKVRAGAIEKVLDSTREGTAVWKDLENKYADFLSHAIASSTDVEAFIKAEISGKSANDILPSEIEALRVLYGVIVEAVAIQRGRVEFFESEMSVLKHWRDLRRMEAFQIIECQELGEAGLLAGYEMEMAFSNWEIIASGLTYAWETILSGVYQEWQSCLLSELSELYQDDNFTGFECEAGAAAGMREAVFHLGLLFNKLDQVGTAFDGALAT